MSPVKETNFFEKDWGKLPPELITPNKNRIDTFEKYCKLFEDVKDEIAIGEASPNYLFHYKSSSELILRYLPDVQLIAILRNPIDRAYSDYLMHVREATDVAGKVQPLSEQLKFRYKGSFTLKKGLYNDQLKHFFEKFNRHKIKVYLYDDLCKNYVALLQDIYRFIGVDETFIPDVSKKAQVAQIPKVKLVNNLLRKQNPLRTMVASGLRYILPLEVRQTVRLALINMNSTDKKKAALSKEERQQLLEFYRDDILKLQDLIQRDLSVWLTV
ncbi:MAG: sulfotransferase [Moorea sp. SIO3I7]|uniref:sulfotransferase domain-containing protein n=1 Tax=unclassified Moorena TaxID=2683338 RepID=UPI0013C0B50B|nr:MULTISPECIES: sulfotransferase domain-containing protein [unclassified Moorena]NEN96406.1 sulfotransferase [Moorena sp. SIO3I7]NEO09955.1 sulfotransferase [Moorena sp. SIO3I8]NEP24429.1 sulfotransferase [Moorena sp. SIO3I6]